MYNTYIYICIHICIYFMTITQPGPSSPAEPGETKPMYTIDSPSLNTTWPATPHTRTGSEPFTNHTYKTKTSKSQVEVRSAWTRQNPDPGEPGNIWPSPSERSQKRDQIWANKLCRIMEQSLAEGKYVGIGLGEPAWQNTARPHARPGEHRLDSARPHTKPGKALPGNNSHYDDPARPGPAPKLINPAQSNSQERDGDLT